MTISPLSNVVDPTSLAFFNSQINTKAVIADPRYQPVSFPSRTPKHESSEDAFIASTLATPLTVPYLLALRLRNPPPILVSANITPDPIDLSDRPPEFLTLCHVNHIGGSGHPRILHGGLLVSLIDETLSVLAMFYQKRSTYTATLTIDFIAPVRLPGTVIVKTWMEKGDGKRKWWCRCEVVHWVEIPDLGKTKGTWEVCGRARGLWIEVKEKL